MWPGLQKLVFGFKCLLAREDGQDLVEYALIIALMSTGATAGMRGFANLILTVLNGLTTQLGNFV